MKSAAGLYLICGALSTKVQQTAWIRAWENKFS